MSLLLDGYGQRLGLMADGLGIRVPQTAQPSTFNTPLVDPTQVGRQKGDDGDVEYAIFTPRPTNPYNARDVEIFLPEALVLPPSSIDRLRRALQVLKPLTCSIRMRTTRGPERVVLQDVEEAEQ